MIAMNVLVVFVYIITNFSAAMFVNLSEAKGVHRSSAVTHNLRTQSPDLKEIEGKDLLSLVDEKVEHLHELTIQYPFSNPTFAGFPTFVWSYQNIHSKKWNRAYIVGVNPLFGDSVVNLNAVLVPIKVSITPHRADGPISFSAKEAVYNIAKSPIFNNAQFPNGNGQYLTQLLKANFPYASANWKVQFNKPRINDQIDWEFNGQKGGVENLDAKYPVGLIYRKDFAERFFADYIEEQVLNHRAIPGTVFIFVIQSTLVDDDGGFHSSYQASNGFTYFYICTSWFNSKNYPPQYSPDIYYLSHEIADWAFNYETKNDSPTWTCPTFKGSLSENNCLDKFEVADVLKCGNGVAPAGKKYYSNAFKDYGYSIQSVALWQWFTGNSSVTGYNGAYSFPDTSLLTTPAQSC